MTTKGEQLTELKPEDVMRALGHCAKNHINECKKCPYRNHNHCFGTLLEDALALHREKDATLEMCAETIERQDKEIAKKDAEIERVKNELQLAKNTIQWLEQELDRIKSINRMLRRDKAYLEKKLESRVEEVYADFMAEYERMKEELDEVREELDALKEGEA